MIVHSFQTHSRDRWCAEFHIRTYLKFCDWVVVAVDETDGGETVFSASLRAIADRVAVVEFCGPAGLPDSRTNEHGVAYHEAAIRQCSLSVALTFDPTLIVFGDSDEVPTPDVMRWIKEADAAPQNGNRWYAHWVNLFGDYRHAIGGQSAWSFENPRGNKKCLAMQPGGDMTYVGNQHTGTEPGRHSGGPSPTGPTHHLIESPKLLHMKYGSEIYPARPESKLARHDPAEMLQGGHVVDVPAEWLWEGTPK